MTDPGRHEDEWDRIERLTKRVTRAGIVGIGTWLALLALLNPGYTNLPLGVGLTMATVIAVAAVIVDDRRRTAAAARGLTPFARTTLTWSVAFVVLALVVGGAGATGAALIVIPFAGATLAAGLMVLVRAGLGQGRPGGPPRTPPRRRDDG